MDIHPEASSILKQHGVETHATYGFHYVLYPEAKRAVSQALYERDEARAKLEYVRDETTKELIKNGVIESLRAQVAAMREAIANRKSIYVKRRDANSPNNQYSHTIYDLFKQSVEVIEILEGEIESALSTLKDQSNDG